MSIDTTKPVALLKSDGSLLQLNLASSVVTSLRASGQASDMTSRTFAFPDSTPLGATATFPANALQLKNEMLDFLYGFSTPRVSPYNTAPYAGSFPSSIGIEFGFAPPAGYIALITQQYGPRYPSEVCWLCCNAAITQFFFLDYVLLVYRPYDLANHGMPILINTALPGTTLFPGGGYIDSYFSPVGRSTSDGFPGDPAQVLPINNEYHAIPSAGPYTVTVAKSGSFYADVLVTNTNTIPLIPFQKVNSNPGTNQYSVSAGVYTFSSGNAGNGAYLSYTYKGSALAGSILPDDLTTALPYDQSSDGAPSNPSVFSWTFVDASPNTISSAIDDSLVQGIPVRSPGNGLYAVGNVGKILGGGTGARYRIVSISPLLAVLNDNGTGYANATGVATSPDTGSGSGLTLDITVVGANRNHPVTLANPDAPKVWDLVKGGYHDALSVAIPSGYPNAGKRYLVPMLKTSSADLAYGGPLTGTPPQTLSTPMMTAAADNPTLDAAVISAYGALPAGSMRGFGYSVEDNAWEMVNFSPSPGYGSCQPFYAVGGRVLYNFFTHSGSGDFYHDCRPSLLAGYTGGPGVQPPMPPGPCSTSRQSAETQSISDLANALSAAGVPTALLPAFANILASAITQSQITFPPDPQWVAPNITAALATAAVQAGATEALATAAPDLIAELQKTFGDAAFSQFKGTNMQTLFQTFFNSPGVALPSGFTVNGFKAITLATVPPMVVNIPVWNGTPTNDLGFINVPAGLSLPSPVPDPFGYLSWNPLNALWQYALPQGQNIWWYFDTNKSVPVESGWWVIPMPVYIPNSNPTPNPGPPPTGNFDGSTNLLTKNLLPWKPPCS